MYYLLIIYLYYLVTLKSIINYSKPQKIALHVHYFMVQINSWLPCKFRLAAYNFKTTFMYFLILFRKKQSVHNKAQLVNWHSWHNDSKYI